jgi:hypothetical protein
VIVGMFGSSFAYDYDDAAAACAACCGSTCVYRGTAATATAATKSASATSSGLRSVSGTATAARTALAKLSGLTIRAVDNTRIGSSGCPVLSCIYRSKTTRAAGAVCGCACFSAAAATA